MHLKLQVEDCSKDKGDNDGTINECVQRNQVKNVWMDSSGSGVESCGGLLAERSF